MGMIEVQSPVLERVHQFLSQERYLFVVVNCYHLEQCTTWQQSIAPELKEHPVQAQKHNWLHGYEKWYYLDVLVSQNFCIRYWKLDKS